jgi:predicted nucleic-acid-binding protein
MGGRTVKVTVDTNVLVRAATLDDAGQAARATEVLREAEAVVAVSACLCEFAWVLMRGYRWSGPSTAAFIRRLIDAANVKSDRPAVEAGLDFLDRGGDFADGVIAFEGRRLGGAVFTTFDRVAARLAEASGGEVRLLDPGP